MRRSGEGYGVVSLTRGEKGPRFIPSTRDGNGPRFVGDTADRGQATLEMALILPLLVLCVAGIVWVGQVMAMQVRLENAAREGARAAAVQPEAASAVAQAAVTRSVSGAVVSTSVGAEFIEVTVSVEVEGVPLVGVGNRTLEADVAMRREDILNP